MIFMIYFLGVSDISIVEYGGGGLEKWESKGANEKGESMILEEED